MNGEIVVSHDIPVGGTTTLKQLLEIHRDTDASLTLALNIKSDGLQRLLVDLLAEFSVQNYFLFDMSLPDTINYYEAGLHFYTRLSEYESPPLLYDHAEGVWVDAFNSDWWDEEVLQSHLDKDKSICLVSPELHQRDHTAAWERLARMNSSLREELLLCTDYPEKANEVLNA